MATQSKLYLLDLWTDLSRCQRQCTNTQHLCTQSHIHKCTVSLYIHTHTHTHTHTHIHPPHTHTHTQTGESAGKESSYADLSPSTNIFPPPLSNLSISFSNVHPLEFTVCAIQLSVD